MNERYEPDKRGMHRVVAKHESGETESFELKRNPHKDVYEGEYRPRLGLGEYLLWVEAGGTEAMEHPLRLVVEEANLEKRHPELKEDVLEKLAGVTASLGGEYMFIDRLSELRGKIRARPAVFTTPQNTRLWDRWSIFILFAALLVVEWVWRKQLRML